MPRRMYRESDLFKYLETDISVDEKRSAIGNRMRQIPKEMEPLESKLRELKDEYESLQHIDNNLYGGGWGC